jgi:hypothetical protein
MLEPVPPLSSALESQVQKAPPLTAKVANPTIYDLFGCPFQISLGKLSLSLIQPEPYE